MTCRLLAIALWLTAILCQHGWSQETRFPMLAPCKPEGLKETILCGRLRVPENRESKSSRKISIDIYLFPSFKSNPPTTPFVDYNGGPGVPNETLLSIYEKGGFSADYRSLRDVVIVDQRGTGASEIRCRAFRDVKMSILLFDSMKVKKCRKEIERTYDLSQYNTENTVKDLEAVRKFLKIRSIDFHGISYGTRVGLEFLRRYPKSVNSMILTGTVPPSFGYAQFVDIEIDRQMEKLIIRCKKNRVCEKSFPEFEHQLFALRTRFEKNPEVVEFTPKNSRSTLTIRLDGEIFKKIIGGFMLSGTQNERLPLLINEAYKGNIAPLLRTNVKTNPYIMPLFLSQFCSEEISRFPASAVHASFGELFTSGEIGKMESEVCKEWIPLQSPKWLTKTLTGQAPVLLLTGADDTQTPPRMAEKVSALLPNTRHIVFPDQGHSLTNWSCWDKIVKQFLKRKDLKRIDASCIRGLKRPEFATEIKDIK